LFWDATVEHEVRVQVAVTGVKEIDDGDAGRVRFLVDVGQHFGQA
jgi:hypothetical protein